MSVVSNPMINFIVICAIIFVLGLFTLLSIKRKNVKDETINKLKNLGFKTLDKESPVGKELVDILFNLPINPKQFKYKLRASSQENEVLDNADRFLKYVADNFHLSNIMRNDNGDFFFILRITWQMSPSESPEFEEYWGFMVARDEDSPYVYLKDFRVLKDAPDTDSEKSTDQHIFESYLREKSLKSIEKLNILTSFESFNELILSSANYHRIKSSDDMISLFNVLERLRR